jgi:tRNA-specific 2-thiouridylase
MNKKVVVAMSGGVDSSVAAALIKKSGVETVGVFTRLYPSSSRGSEKKAREVAKILEIPFYILNFEKEFKKKVVDYFLREYKKGRTPNPCVVCNKEIKFGLLLKQAKKMKADFLATGHYVKKATTKTKLIYKLLRAKDKSKDQSYFLWKLNQRQLKYTLFPIGNYTKKEVKSLAKKFKLPVLNVPESQEICFIENTCNDFLSKHLKLNPGKIIDAQGKIIGKHNGLWFYTVGQRKGIKLPGGPFYVVDKNLKKNLLIVSKNKKDLERKELTAQNVNWISGKEPNLPLDIKAKIRYRHKLASAIICQKKQKTKYEILFKKPQRAITPGQSVVFYKGTELLGGGIIS